MTSHLTGWLSAGDKQDYFIEICDEILVALFCVVGSRVISAITLTPLMNVRSFYLVGLAPFRTVDSESSLHESILFATD